MHLPTDPLFWIVAAIAVTLLGLAKGGFTGVGMVATPMLALIIPPLQAVADHAADPAAAGRDLGAGPIGKTGMPGT